jgi:MFS family permease
VVLALLAVLLAGDRARAEGQSDAPGTVLLAAAVTAWALAMTLGGLAAVVLVAVAALLAVVFLRVERRAAAPLLPLGVMTLPGMRAGLAGNAVVATVMMATLVAGPFWLTAEAGLTAAQAGLVLAAGPVVSALSGVPSGRAVDRFGAAAVLRAGLWLMLAGAAGLAVLPGWLGVAGWLAPVAVLTPGYQLFQAANTVQVMAAAPAAQRGVLAGVLALARNLGLVTGAALMGALYAGAGLGVTFGLAAALLALALAMRPAPPQAMPA